MFDLFLGQEFEHLPGPRMFGDFDRLGVKFMGTFFPLDGHVDGFLGRRRVINHLFPSQIIPL
jgi:hypothetical protein